MNLLGPDVATIRTSGCIVFSHGGNGCRRICLMSLCRRWSFLRYSVREERPESGKRFIKVSESSGGKQMWELIICPRSLSNSLCWEKNTNLMRRRYRRQDLPFSQTGSTAERNSSESREWAEKIEAFGENQFPKNCRDVFAELNDLTAEVRNKFTEEENG